MKKVYFLPLCFSLLLSCGGKDESEDLAEVQSPVTAEIAETEEVSESDDSYLDMVSIESGDVVVLDDPQTFIEMNILYNHFSYLWNENATDEQRERIDDYLSEKRTAFYASYGLSEQDIIDYNIKHYEEVQEFLDENEDFDSAYRRSSKF